MGAAEANCPVGMLGWAGDAEAGRRWGAGWVPPTGPGGREVLQAGVAIAELSGRASEEAAA